MPDQPSIRRTFAAGTLVLAVSTLMTLGGCAANTNPPTPGQDPVPASAYPQVIVSPSLTSRLVADEPIVVPATDIPLAVRVPVRSVDQHAMFLEYRFIFYGPNKKQLTQNPVWRSVTFPPRTRRMVSANAISLEAMDWELEIRHRH